MKVLITGIAGTGKSSAIKELRVRGYNVIDLDDHTAAGWVNKHTGEVAEYREGAGKKWIEDHRWQVLTSKLLALFEKFPADQDIYVGGKVASVQTKEISEIFDVIYLLQPKDSVVDVRLESRTTNEVNFGKKQEERESIIQNRHKFEASCLEVGAIPLHNHGTVHELLDIVLGPK
jgi:broad-specificity NMP kinase